MLQGLRGPELHIHIIMGSYCSIFICKTEADLVINKQQQQQKHLIHNCQNKPVINICLGSTSMHCEVSLIITWN